MATAAFFPVGVCAREGLRLCSQRGSGSLTLRQGSRLVRIRAMTATANEPTMSSSPQTEVPGLRHTVWDQQNQTPKYPKITKDESADVVVVGAGIAGLSVAYNLVREGKSVIVLEGRTRGSGQTGRTTAHIMAWNDDYYYLVEKMHGTERAKLVADSHRAAIDKVESIVKEENLDCHFCRVDGYLIPYEESPTELAKLDTEFEASQRLGFDVEMVDLSSEPKLGNIRKAIRFPGCGEFHPLMYINGLAEAFKKRGGKLYEMSKVMKVEGRHQVETADGVKVTAKEIVMATNSPLNQDLIIHARQTADRSYVVGLKVEKGALKRAQWWDTFSPYRYIRLEDKDEYDVLIVGGADTSTGMKPEEYGDPHGFLTEWARERWPQAGEVVYKWTGQVMKPADSLHLFGREPIDNYYIVTGDSGQGMTGSTIAGILITDLIMGRENPWASVYSPSRGLPVSLSSLQGAVQEAEHTFEGLKDALPFAGTDNVGVEQLPPTKGAVIQQGLSKVAVYRDGDGKVHTYSAVCPHLKCIVKWNPIDSTFDCPCHGSIFDCYGKCINGPSKADLSPYET